MASARDRFNGHEVHSHQEIEKAFLNLKRPGLGWLSVLQLCKCIARDSVLIKNRLIASSLYQHGNNWDHYTDLGEETRPFQNFNSKSESMMPENWPLPIGDLY